MLLDLCRKNEGNPFSTKIWVVGSYTDTLFITLFYPSFRGKKIKTPALVQKPFFHYKLISEHTNIYIRLKGYWMTFPGLFLPS